VNTPSARHLSLVTIIFAALMPTVAVSVGMHLLHNGWAALLLYHTGILALIARDSQLGPMLRHARSGFRMLPCLALTCLCMLSGVLIFCLWPWLYFRTMPFDELLAEYGLSSISRVIFVLYFSLIHPVIEESYWRGWFVNRGAALSPAIQDIAFAAFHASILVLFIAPGWTLVAFTVLALIARTWRCVAQRYNGLAIPIVSHAVADFTIVVAGCLMV
jgi:membrane protease YdiL (CAAX protease family)